MKTKGVILEILLIAFIGPYLFFGCTANATDGNNEKIYDIPVYQSVYKIKFFDESDLATGVAYQARVNYPANELIEFYENAMSSRGYKAEKNIDMPGCDGEWSYYVDGTIESKPSVASTSLCWKKGEEAALLLLRYYYYEKNSSPIVLETLDDIEVTFIY